MAVLGVQPWGFDPYGSPWDTPVLPPPPRGRWQPPVGRRVLPPFPPPGRRPPPPPTFPIDMPPPYPMPPRFYQPPTAWAWSGGSGVSGGSRRRPPLGVGVGPFPEPLGY